MKILPKPLRQRAEHFLSEEAGRVVFGNLLGFENNRIARSRLRTARRQAGPIPDVSGAAELRRDGCAFYGGIDRDKLETVRREYFAAIEDPTLADSTGRSARRLAGPGEPVYRVILKDVAKALPSVLDLIDADLMRFLTSYYQANFRLHSMEAWRIFYVPEDVLAAKDSPYSLRWHVDHHPPDTMKLFIALDDIGPGDGPLHFVTRQRSGELIRAGYRNRHSYGGAAAMLEGQVTRLAGPAGTAAFCNPTTNLHRAGIPEPGHRRDMLQFRFEAAAEPFDPKAPLTAVKPRKSA